MSRRVCVVACQRVSDWAAATAATAPDSAELGADPTTNDSGQLAARLMPGAGVGSERSRSRSRSRAEVGEGW